MHRELELTIKDITMKIVTLTLSAAYDVHCSAEKISLGCENHVCLLSRDAGGKGINISRALSAFGVESVALAVLGEENSHEFMEYLSHEGVSVTPIFTEGRIRENITVHEAGGIETRISFGSSAVPESVLTKIEEITSVTLTEGDVLTFTGSIPEGISRSAVTEYLKRERQRGIKVIVDSRSLTKEDVVSIGPYLIKPNEYEIQALSGSELYGADDARRTAEDLCTLGIENVMITLGKVGAVIASPEGSFFASAPSVEVSSTIGAGDSAIAGFIYAISNGESVASALCTSVAFGTAACLESGTKPPSRTNVLRMLENGIFIV